jgi:hypothetical protein
MCTNISQRDDPKPQDVDVQNSRLNVLVDRDYRKSTQNVNLDGTGKTITTNLPNDTFEKVSVQVGNQNGNASSFDYEIRLNINNGDSYFSFKSGTLNVGDGVPVSIDHITDEDDIEVVISNESNNDVVTIVTNGLR